MNPSHEEVVAKQNAKKISKENRTRCFKQDVLLLLVALLIFATVVILGLFSTLPSLGAPALPAFNNPLKGFEPRGTYLSNRIYTIGLLDKYIKQNQLIAAQSQANSSSSRRRRSVTTRCSDTYFGRIAYGSKSSKTLMTSKNLKDICHMETEIMKSSPSMFDSEYLGGCRNCCSSVSLGGVVAQFANKTNCESINDSDVQKTLQILQNCSVYLHQGLLRESCSCSTLDMNGVSQGCQGSVPCFCSWKKLAYTAFSQLVDSEFLKTPDYTTLKYSATLSPTKFESKEFYKDIYDKHFQKAFPEKNDVKVVGFDFGRFRFQLFNTVVVENAKFPFIAMAFVLVFMWCFLKSFILSLLSMLTVIFALVLSYFLYAVAFGITFFPFLNLLTLVFIVGIGADDAFVYYDIFRQTKRENPKDDLITLTIKTLRDAALSMFVTSFTTSAAFFANVTSDISSIKTFGIFAGLSILTNYLLMITWFPVIVILHERWVRKNNIDQMVESSDDEEINDKKAPVENHISNRTGKASLKERTPISLCCKICWGIDFPCHFCSIEQSPLSKISSKVFHSWLPNSILKKRLYLLWLFLIIGLSVGFACVCLVSPGLQLPSTKDFQVFSSSSLIEQYNLHIKNHFRYDSQDSGSLVVEMVWGINPVDNGNYLDPDNKGTIEFDSTFNFKDYTSASSQQWLSSLCNSLRNQSFFSGEVTSWRGGSLCAIETIRQKCSEPNKPSCCSSSTFPFPKDVIDNCSKELKLTNPDIYYSNRNKPIVLRMLFHSGVYWTAQYKPMDTFWNQVDLWSKEQFSKAPYPYKNGWTVCRRIYRTYSVQWSLQRGTISSLGIAIGIAFGVMLMTTLNVFISLYAIITIIGIIAMTVGCLVLIGWELSVLESIVISVAVGLSIDFTMHYGVAYRISPYKDNRKERVRFSLVHIGSAIFMAAFTTFITGLIMLPADVLVYIQLGQFLMLVMVFSWFFATFGFLSLGAFIGPANNFGQLSLSRFCRRKRKVNDNKLIGRVDQQEMEQSNTNQALDGSMEGLDEKPNKNTQNDALKTFQRCQEERDDTP